VTQPRPARALDVPTVLVGLGRFGADVARRLADERGEALRLAGQPAEADDLRHVLQDLSHQPDRFDPQAAAADVLAAVRAVLQHRRVVAARELADDSGLTRLHILVFAELGEPAVRGHLLPVLKAIEHLLLSQLGPIFESYRVGAARGAAILPILTMPHPPAHPQGAQIAAAVVDLLTKIAAAPPEARAIPQLYLLEDVAERSILAEGELRQCLRNFASLLLYSGDLEILQQIVYGDDPNEPLATFVCAVAELPRARLAAYGAHRIALEVLAAVREAPRVDTELAALDALEQLEARALSQIDDADKDVHAVLQRYAPAVAREPTIPWWHEGAVLLERLGPDPGDPSLLTPAAPGDPPQGWIHARMLEIQETWRLLQRRRFDDVVARDRAAVEAWRDRLLRQLRERLDESLWSAPSPAAFRQTEELAAKLSRAFGEQLERAIAERDAITPAKAPSFDELRAAHAAALDAARHKPEVAALALWAALFLSAFLLFLPPLFRLVALTLGLQSGALAFLLRDHPQLSALLLALLRLPEDRGAKAGLGDLARAQERVPERSTRGATALDHLLEEAAVERWIALVAEQLREALLHARSGGPADRARLDQHGADVAEAEDARGLLREVVDVREDADGALEQDRIGRDALGDHQPCSLRASSARASESTSPTCPRQRPTLRSTRSSPSRRCATCTWWSPTRTSSQSSSGGASPIDRSNAA
jgi:hypothetical protein